MEIPGLNSLEDVSEPLGAILLDIGFWIGRWEGLGIGSGLLFLCTNKAAQAALDSLISALLDTQSRRLISFVGFLVLYSSQDFLALWAEFGQGMNGNCLAVFAEFIRHRSIIGCLGGEGKG